MLSHEELAARRYLYETFHVLLGEDPVKGAWEAIDEALVEEACGIMGIAVPSALIERLARMRVDEDARAAIAHEHTRALVGPGKLPSPPWETVHVTGEEALFSLVTLDVRNAYRAEGLLPSAYPAVSDDHIALECGFLAALAQRALEAFEQGDAERCAHALEAGRAFAREHPLKWVDAFAEGLMAAGCTFYGEAAATLAALMRADAS